MKKIAVALILATLALSTLCGCGTKTLKCDFCGADVVVPANSNMTDEWTIACEKCADEKGLNDIDFGN